jgi:hypothetical protein
MKGSSVKHLTFAIALMAATALPLAGTGPVASAAISSSASTVPPVSSSASTVPSFGHVFVIVGENKSLFQLTPSNAPYIMNTLEPESAWFTNYNDVTKGSLADYVALTSGQFAPCQPMGPCGNFNVPSIFSQLGNGAWDDWNESMPANCYPSAAGSESDLNAYKQGHNPALYYTGLPCSTYDVPAGTTGPDNMSTFNNDLAAGTVPEYNLVSPNLCEDSYHSCNGANIITEYDNFLKKEIPLIEASPAFGSNGVIFATYDEGYEPTGDPNTMMAVVGPQVQAGTYSGYYDHYSTVATVEQGLGLPCLANACTAGTLPIFGNVPSPSVSITQPADGSTVSGTVTITGTAAAQGSASINQVQISVDGHAPQTTAAGTTSWSASINTTGLAKGTHTFTAIAGDSNNLTSSASITLNVNNSAGPSVSITQPASGSTVSGTVAVSGTASDSASTISQVQVSVDGGTPVIATGTTSWSTDIDTTSLTNGMHTITVTATDADGNTGTASESITVNNSTTTTSCPAPANGVTELSGNVSVESNQSGWTGIYNADSAVTRVEPAGGSYDGLWALQVAPKSGDSGAAGLSNAKPVWVTSTTAGTVYQGSVFVRASAPGEKVTLVLREETSSGATVSSHTTTMTLSDTNWHQITSSYTAQDTGDALHYSVYASNLASSSQNFLADCLSLQTP